MKEVNVRRDALTERLMANREKHRTDYKAAVEGWAKEVMEVMRKDMKALDTGWRHELTHRDPMPEDHTADYDRVLEMLKMSQDDCLVIDMATFRQYVLDDWSWKERWSVSTAKYIAGN